MIPEFRQLMTACFYLAIMFGYATQSIINLFFTWLLLLLTVQEWVGPRL